MKKALLGSLISAALLTSFNLSAATAGQAVDAQAATDNASKVSQQKIDSYAESAESALAQYKAALRQVDSLRAYNEQVGKMVDSQSAELASMQKQIAQIDQGTASDEEGTIIFCARYESEGKAEDHWEQSFFRKEKGEWKFLDAKGVHIGTYRREEPKIGRNDPCPCGSGKKYKKCCGA